MMILLTYGMTFQVKDVMKMPKGSTLRTAGLLEGG
jgi:hypothetical protein